MKLAFYGKQLAKMAMQNQYMPRLYQRNVKQNPQIQKGLILFADSHTDPGTIPFSMRKLFAVLSNDSRYTVKACIANFDKMGYGAMLRWINSFMALYAKAEYVFICNNFLPVSACEKRPETTVIQLWHSGGLMKKAGYDTADDIPKYYKGDVYKNYDLVTVSAPCCVPVFHQYMRQPEGVVVPTGISRSDYYFQNRWNEKNQEAFFAAHPEAKGKKVILWAPTFRGNAASPTLYGMDAIRRVMEQTGDRYHWVIKLHPHLEGKGMNSNCSIPCEELFAAANLLITDYSSTLFDYLAYKKPFVLFAPDLEEFQKTRGFYVPYDSFPTTVAQNEAELEAAIANELQNRNPSDLAACYDYHMTNCKGRATYNILKQLNLL